MKKIAVVTVNYNTENYTKNLLTSLEKSEKNNFNLQIIVVDNGSQKKFVFNKEENIAVYRTEKNLGFAGGYNIGIREALRQNADYILILNNDTEVYPGMIKNLLQTAEEDQKIGVTVPKIYFYKGHEFHKDRYKLEELGKVIWYAGGFTDWKNVKSIHRGVDEVDHGQYDKIEPVDFATGCSMLIKKEVFEKAGLFDERYFLYYEDSDLVERIKNAGYKIYYVPSAVLIHINAGSTGGVGNNLHDYFLTRNQMLFGLTYAPFMSKIALLKQSLKLLIKGRPFQKKAIRDFYLKKFGKGSYVQTISHHFN